ncbi:MAG: hypothetical protein WBF17_10070 [Phycisphaerae bacterium]
MKPGAKKGARTIAENAGMVNMLVVDKHLMVPRPQAEDQQIKLDLIAALGQAGTKEDQPFLAKLAGDEDAATARAAREAMTAIAERE